MIWGGSKLLPEKWLDALRFSVKIETVFSAQIKVFSKKKKKKVFTETKTISRLFAQINWPFAPPAPPLPTAMLVINIDIIVNYSCTQNAKRNWNRKKIGFVVIIFITVAFQSVGPTGYACGVKPPPCVIDRLEGGSLTWRPKGFRFLLAKATWWIRCNSNYILQNYHYLPA